MTSAVAGVAIAVGTVGILLTSRGIMGQRDEPAAGTDFGVPARLTLFAYRGPFSFVAVVGVRSNGPATVLAIPSEMLTDVPEQKSSTLGTAVATSGSLARMATANLLGTWIDHYVVLDELGFREVLTRRGGLTLNLPPGVRIGERVIGPGPATLAPDEVLEYLHARQARERQLRWVEVLRALFQRPVTMGPFTAASTDDPKRVRAVLAGVRDAEVVGLDAETGAGGLQVADPAVVRQTLAEVFGIVRGEPVRVIVLDGVTTPMAGEAVANVLIPRGYRVSAFGEARMVPRETTLILASIREALPHAQHIRELLGVGRVALSRSPSGLGDLTVVIGRDFFRE